MRSTDQSQASVSDDFTLEIANVFTGTGGADTLVGTNGADVLYGLNGDAGPDVTYGGPDNDTYVVDQAGDVVTENPNEGTDTVETGINYTLAGTVEILTLTGPIAKSSFHRLPLLSGPAFLLGPTASKLRLRGSRLALSIGIPGGLWHLRNGP